MRRLSIKLLPDPRRVVVLPFQIAIEPRSLNPTDLPRAKRIAERVAALPENEIEQQFARLLNHFHHRHRSLERIIDRRVLQIAGILESCGPLTVTAKRFIAAHFCHEYSPEAAALFNPSIIRHHTQPGGSTASVRFILSLRSVGEGHVSSISFRTGVWEPHINFEIDPAADLAQVGEVADPLAFGNDDGSVSVVRPEGTPLREFIIFPMTPAQRNGIEDLRLTEFVEEDGSVLYYGTYTAYSGGSITSELLFTPDFQTFTLRPLRGAAALNKGMALFPRRIGGKFAMLSRIDNEHLYVSYSDDIYYWENAKRILGPKYPWEFIQVGNCGAPMEIDEGWLVIMHAVGAMRQYSISACLLDKDDPSKIIARSAKPILLPDQDERAGYVPNVVYSCGALLVGRELMLPYGIADCMVGFAGTTVDELLESMEPA